MTRVSDGGDVFSLHEKKSSSWSPSTPWLPSHFLPPSLDLINCSLPLLPLCARFAFCFSKLDARALFSKGSARAIVVPFTLSSFPAGTYFIQIPLLCPPTRSRIPVLLITPSSRWGRQRLSLLFLSFSHSADSYVT